MCRLQDGPCLCETLRPVFECYTYDIDDPSCIAQTTCMLHGIKAFDCKNKTEWDAAVMAIHRMVDRLIGSLGVEFITVIPVLKSRYQIN